MKLRTVTAAVFVTLAVVAVAAAAPGTRRPPVAVFAVEQDRSVARIGDAYHLVRLDPVTLERLAPMSFSLAHTGPYTASPRGRFLVFASDNAAGRPYVRFVDGREFRPLGSVRVAHVRGDEIRWLEWTRSNHVFAAGDNFVALVNPSTRRLVWSKRLPGADDMLVEKTPTGIVQLRAPKGRIGRATLAIADARRGLRVTRLRIRAGRDPGPDSASSTMRQPGLAVDSAGRRAFVVDTDYAVAIVDLASLRTRYVPLRPPARQIGANAFIQTAYWMGNGKLAVGGWEEPPSGPLINAGFRLIDIGNGKARTISRRVNLLHFDGHSLLAEEDDVLIAYAPDGTPRFTIPMPSDWIQVVGRYGYMIGDGTEGGRDRRTVVDLDTGAIVNQLEPPFWRTPVAEAAP